MSKTVWVVLALVAVFASVLVTRARTANDELRPYLGKWTGGFYADPSNKKRDLIGYLQIYATGMTFKMHIEAAQQQIDVNGTWTLEKKQVVLKPNDVHIEDFGGADSRNPNLDYYPNEAVRAAYSKPVVLNASADGKVLSGLLMSIGDREGEHRFDWGGSGR